VSDPAKRIKVDFHVHTVHSPDSVITFEMLVDGCRANGVDALAIMDHDVFDGAVEFKERADAMRERGEWAPLILPGEEVRTLQGEICGLFLSEHVPRHLPARETMELIREQGALVYVPHPFDILKLKRMKARELVELKGMIDIIEAYNGKPRYPGANAMARRFLSRNPFPAAAGSDSHDPTRLGAACVEMEEFDGPADLLEKLGGGTITGKMYSPFASAYMRYRMRREDRA
jgi:predicted metal-dependent phosphoesterase TrpH